MGQYELFVSQVVLIVAGLVFNFVVNDYLLEPPNDDLRIALSRSFPTDHSSLVEAQTLLVVLNHTRLSHQVYVDTLFALNYLARHLFPPLDYMFALRAFMFMKKFHVTGVLIYSSNEFYLNSMAGSLYGKWLAIVLSCSLTAVASFISWLVVRLVTLVLQMARQNRRPTVAQLVLNLLLRDDDNDDELERMQLQPNGRAFHDDQLFERQFDELRQEVVQEMLDQSMFISIMWLILLRQLPYSPTWLLNLVLANLGIPIYLVIPAMALGYAPYVFFCAKEQLMSVQRIDDDRLVKYNTENAIVVFVATNFMLINYINSLWNMRQWARANVNGQFDGDEELDDEEEEREEELEDNER